MTLPTFLVIGAMKAGTTSLSEYLRTHPQVFLPTDKELCFFHSSWQEGFEWYESFFPNDPDGAVAIGEASTEYTRYPHVPDVPARAASLIPDARLIYVVRHPIERIRSHYQHQALPGVEIRPLERAVLEDPVYVDTSRYAMQIEQYLRHFRRDQLLVITSERLRDDRTATLEEVFRFIGVDPTWTSEVMAKEFLRTVDRGEPRSLFKSLQRVPGYRAVRERVPGRLKRATYGLRTGQTAQISTVSDRLRAQLEDLLRDDMRKLRSYLGQDFHCWGIV
jgi:hypothetical protein